MGFSSQYLVGFFVTATRFDARDGVPSCELKDFCRELRQLRFQLRACLEAPDSNAVGLACFKHVERALTFQIVNPQSRIDNCVRQALVLLRIPLAQVRMLRAAQGLSR